MSINNYDSIVSKQEVAELKEMIFKRVREKAAALAENENAKYTSSAKFDVMELAHNSMSVAKGNPFAEIANGKIVQSENLSANVEKNEITEEVSEEPVTEKYDFFKQKSVLSTREIVNKAIELNMENAREDLSKKTSFMGALNFLNSQAAVSLVNTAGKRGFNALA